jgi:predicted Rossmann-fold nucleotide-binding protein
LLQIGVIGAGQAGPEEDTWAEAVGRELARRGAVLLCGGLSGVMEAAARGATDMGHARNVVLVRSSDGLIAVGGGFGTLSEIAIALKIGKPIVSLGSWELGPSIIVAQDPLDAVEKILRALDRG